MLRRNTRREYKAENAERDASVIIGNAKRNGARLIAREISSW